MPFPVKLLVAGVGLGARETGAVIEVVSSAQDWGAATVAPKWIRATISNMPGTTQEAAEDNARDLLSSWADAFTYSEVAGAGAGQQRYRVEASQQIANDFGPNAKVKLRDHLLAWFQSVSGDTTTIANQSGTHVEYDSVSGIPLSEIENELMGVIDFNRYVFPQSLVDQALGSVNAGEPAHFVRTRQEVNALVIDRLKD
jgi:hypothetical protein